MVDKINDSEEFTPDPSRSVYLRGEINQSLLDELTPRILELRANSNAPITVYIDSDGGDTGIAEAILGLLTTETLDGKTIRLITVVTGSAFSAAADFLASGNYSIAYPHSKILFHGTRRLVTRPVTTESATRHAENLKRSNERFALQLARRCISRFLFSFQLLKAEFPSIRATKPDAEDLHCFAELLKQRLSPLAEDLPEIALGKYSRILSLTSHVNSPDPQQAQATANQGEGQQVEADDAAKEEERKAEKQARLLKKIIDFELFRNSDPEWTFDGSFSTLQEDFELLNELTSDKHIKQLRRLAQMYSDWFITEEDAAAIAELDEKDQDRDKIIRAVSRMHPIWFFFVSICRALQEGENFILPIDAYRLGLVDEIFGFQLPCLRRIVEETRNQQTSEDSDVPPSDTAAPSQS